VKSIYTLIKFFPSESSDKWIENILPSKAVHAIKFTI
jgi:hypothetical protein